MYPFGWSTGEPQRKKATFAEFQAYPIEVLEIASKKAGRDWNEMFEEVFEALRRKKVAANDGYETIADQALHILMDEDLTAMLHCWVACNKDMLLTKLTYERGVDYGTKD